MSKSGKLGPQIKEDQKQFRKAMRTILTLASNDAVNFFTENFKRGGFMDNTVIPWEPRKTANMTKKQRKGSLKRGILIGPPGSGARLKNSISRSRGMTYKSVTIGIKGPAQAYASIHNFGLKGKAWGKHPFTMPKRQFMGESRTLNRKILKLINEKVKKAL